MKRVNGLVGEYHTLISEIDFGHHEIFITTSCDTLEVLAFTLSCGSFYQVERRQTGDPMQTTTVVVTGDPIQTTTVLVTGDPMQTTDPMQSNTVVT